MFGQGLDDDIEPWMDHGRNHGRKHALDMDTSPYTWLCLQTWYLEIHWCIMVYHPWFPLVYSYLMAQLQYMEKMGHLNEYLVGG